MCTLFVIQMQMQTQMQHRTSPNPIPLPGLHLQEGLIRISLKVQTVGGFLMRSILHLQESNTRGTNTHTLWHSQGKVTALMYTHVSNRLHHIYFSIILTFFTTYSCHFIGAWTRIPTVTGKLVHTIYTHGTILAGTTGTLIYVWKYNDRCQVQVHI